GQAAGRAVRAAGAAAPALRAGPPGRGGRRLWGRGAAPGPQQACGAPAGGDRPHAGGGARRPSDARDLALRGPALSRTARLEPALRPALPPRTACSRLVAIQLRTVRNRVHT